MEEIAKGRETEGYKKEGAGGTEGRREKRRGAKVWKWREKIRSRREEGRQQYRESEIIGGSGRGAGVTRSEAGSRGP